MSILNVELVQVFSQTIVPRNSKNEDKNTRKKARRERGIWNQVQQVRKTISPDGLAVAVAYGPQGSLLLAAVDEV